MPIFWRSSNREVGRTAKPRGQHFPSGSFIRARIALPTPRAILSLLALVSASLLVGCSTQSTSTTALSPLAPGESRMVTYCNDETARITAPSSGNARAPAVIYLHGGSWIGGDHETGGFIIKGIGPALNAKGFLVASVNYRLGPKEPWPAQIEDAKCAVRFLRANAKVFNIDPAEIGIWGHSAGGHLASLVGTAGPEAGWDTGAYPNESSRVEAVADLSGPSNLVTLEEEGCARTRQEQLQVPSGAHFGERSAGGARRGQPGHVRLTR